MKRKHVTFCLEQQYGHIVPTLGIALELSKRGNRVSYAVISSLAPLITKVNAQALIIDPLDTRIETLRTMVSDKDGSKLPLSGPESQKVEALTQARTERSLAQLKEIYEDDPPDLVLHDDIFDTAARTFAAEMGLPKIRLQSQFIDHDDPSFSANTFDHDQLVIITVPRFFQREPEVYERDERFRFVGFIPEGRSLVFKPWQIETGPHQIILVSATTGMGPQTNYCQTMLDAFRGRSWEVVLSISALLDHTSKIDPATLARVPANIHLNSSAGNFQLLENARLFVGQGGQGATLEAIYWGVPQLVVPPTFYHNQVARRVVELGLGKCLPITELSPERVVREISTLAEDKETLKRTREAGLSMRESRGAIVAADLIECHADSRRH